MQRALFIAKVLRKSKIIQRGILKYFNFSLTKTNGTLKFKIPVLKNIGWNNIFDNEPWMSTLTGMVLQKQKGAFIDVGANIGQTLIKLKFANSEIPYYGFEANPSCVFYLYELIKSNDFKNTFIIPVGLGENQELLALNYFSNNQDDATASVLTELRPGMDILRKEYVQIITLDSYNNLFKAGISIIKIDVEGAELEVLRGARGLIELHRPFIIIEILPSYTEKNKQRISRQAEIENFMRILSYKQFLILKDEQSRFTGLKKIDEIGIRTDIKDRDYLMVPAEADFLSTDEKSN